MKLILNSRGLNTKAGTEQIRRAISKDEIGDKRIFICSYPGYEVDDLIRENCVSMGFNEENILFSKNGIPDEFISYAYVGEGNTFEILDYMRKQNLCHFIIDACKEGATYIGSSAGACCCGKDVKFALDFDSNYVGMRDFTGLQLFDGAIVPHYTRHQLKRYIEESDHDLINSYKEIRNVDNDSVLVLDKCDV